MLFVCLTLAAVPAMAQNDLYNNGPVNGTVDGYTINFGFTVSDSFHLSSSATVDNMSFWAWLLLPGDTLTSVEVQMGSAAFGNELFDQTVNLSASNCFMNNYGYNVCMESGSFSGPALGAGNYWVTLANASVPNGDPAFWDMNSGIGCTSPGCPSMAQENMAGTIFSEAFTLSGAATTTSTGTTPEPGSLLLFASGVLGLAGLLRRKMF
jgi:hypothetical protein